MEIRIFRTTNDEMTHAWLFSEEHPHIGDKVFTADTKEEAVEELLGYINNLVDDLQSIDWSKTKDVTNGKQI